MSLNSKSLAALIAAVLFGGILLTNATGWWHTTTTKVPATFSEGEAAGQYNPADIRGSYTFGDIAGSFGVPLAALQTAFEVPAGVDPASFQVKSLETQYADQGVEIGTNSVRLFVALYTGLPYDLSLGDVLPAAAAQVLREQAALTPERLDYLAAHTVGAAQEPASRPPRSLMGRRLSSKPFQPPRPPKRHPPLPASTARMTLPCGARPPSAKCWTGASPRRASKLSLARPCLTRWWSSAITAPKTASTSPPSRTPCSKRSTGSRLRNPCLRCREPICYTGNRPRGFSGARIGAARP